MSLSTDLQNILNQGQQIEAFIKDIPKHHSTLSLIPTCIGFFVGAVIGTMTVGAPFFAVLAPVTLVGLPTFKIFNNYRNTNKHKQLFRKHGSLDSSLKTELLQQFKPHSLDRDLLNFFTMNVKDYERLTKIDVIKKASKIIDNSSLDTLKNASIGIHSTDFWQYINSVLDAYTDKNRTQQQYKDEQIVIQQIERQLPDLEPNILKVYQSDGTQVYPSSEANTVQVEAYKDIEDFDCPNDVKCNLLNTTKKHSI